MIGQCLAFGGEAEGIQDTVKEGKEGREVYVCVWDDILVETWKAWQLVLSR